MEAEREQEGAEKEQGGSKGEHDRAKSEQWPETGLSRGVKRRPLNQRRVTCCTQLGDIVRYLYMELR